MDTIHNVKKRDRDAGDAATRNHAEAITIEEMKQIYDYSMEQCPQSMVERFLHGKVTPKEYALVCEHTQMRAFTSSAFTLWTRRDCSCIA